MRGRFATKDTENSVADQLIHALYAAHTKIPIARETDSQYRLRY